MLADARLFGKPLITRCFVGKIFNFQKFSINDGPGIRTAVFFKGCPLNCLWCHNPEGLDSASEIEFDSRRCIFCGGCAVVCEKGCHILGDEHIFNRDGCIKCGKCAEACLPGALNLVGGDYTAEEVIAKVLEDKIFYETSGGGVTFSGGEPFYQAEFLLECLRLAKENGLNTAIETSGLCREEDIAEAVKYTDYFLMDYKITGEEAHKRYTGVSQVRILSNMRRVSNLGGKIVLRCPIIPEVNDNDAHFRAIASLAEELNGIISVELEGYHALGIGKSERVGKDRPFRAEPPTRARMEEIKDFIASMTGKPVKLA